jgi:hypothetical protein
MLAGNGELRTVGTARIHLRQPIAEILTPLSVISVGAERGERNACCPDCCPKTEIDRSSLGQVLVLVGEPGWDRTIDPLIKNQMVNEYSSA